MSQNEEKQIEENKTDIAVIKNEFEGFKLQLVTLMKQVKESFDEVKDEIKRSREIHDELRNAIGQHQRTNDRVNKIEEARILEHEETVELKKNIINIEKEMETLKIVKTLVFGLVGAVLMQLVGLTMLLIIAK